jgi:hypothetical protein
VNLLELNWTYYGCSKQDEEQLQRSWDSGERRLRSWLESFPEEPATRINIRLHVLREFEKENRRSVETNAG